jgi:hypothetical protein
VSEPGRFARSVTLRAAIALAVSAAVAGAAIALSASYFLLPDRTVAAIEQKRDSVAEALELPTMGSDLETQVIDTQTAVDDLETQVPDLAWDAVEGDPDRLMNMLEQDRERLREIVNDGGPSTADLCSALDLSSNPDVNDVSFYGC